MFAAKMLVQITKLLLWNLKAKRKEILELNQKNLRKNVYTIKKKKVGKIKVWRK